MYWNGSEAFPIADKFKSHVCIEICVVAQHLQNDFCQSVGELFFK